MPEIIDFSKHSHHVIEHIPAWIGGSDQTKFTHIFAELGEMIDRRLVEALAAIEGGTKALVRSLPDPVLPVYIG